MPEGLFFRKVAGSLYPADDDAFDWLRRRKAASTVLIEPIQVRNVDRLKLYFVLCGLVAENHGELTSKDAVDEAIRNLAGLVHVFSCTLPNGETLLMKRAKSIALASMQEVEFERFLDRVVDIISTYLLPGVDIEEMRKEAYVRAAAR